MGTSLSVPRRSAVSVHAKTAVAVVAVPTTLSFFTVSVAAGSPTV